MLYLICPSAVRRRRAPRRWKEKVLVEVRVRRGRHRESKFSSASPTACLLRGHGRAGIQNDRLSEAVHFEYRHVHTRLRGGHVEHRHVHTRAIHAVGDAEINFDKKKRRAPPIFSSKTESVVAARSSASAPSVELYIGHRRRHGL